MNANSSKRKLFAKAEVKENSFPVVAIGSSAGGLEAMMELLKYLPADTGMAFIYVQHLSPDHKSRLTEILSNKTSMKVQEIDDMEKIKPNNIFVIPHNKGIKVIDGHLKLIPRAVNSSTISIDILFSSLAQAQKERVIGIILSGSASDGTAGMRDIKHEGGLTFVQDDSAKFNSMPHSAIAAGVVDFILSPKEIALELARLSKHPLIKTIGVKNGEEDLIDNRNPDLKTILNLLHKASNVDFSAYKMNTIKRRIIRRMLLYKITALNEYAKLLLQKREEIDILFQDLLINVTSFFRDTDTHKYLKQTLFPKILKTKKSGDHLRIWVAACSTGEEAYSIGMMLHEILEKKTNNPSIHIFATDLSEQAIRKARLGIYTKQELQTVSPKRIQRFFTKANGGFRINKTVRDMCIFAPHNILQDPPFSKLDFISCCNFFIYLDNSAQKKAVNTFHYALNDTGFLMLGKSENISQSANLFTGSNKKYKIFSRKVNSGIRILPALLPRYSQQIIPENNLPQTHKIKTKQIMTSNNNVLSNAIDALLVSEFMPASVVINHQLEIVQFRGTTELFLSHPQGKATLNILKMARPELAFELRNAISKVIKKNQRLRKSGIELKVNEQVKIISIEIVPLKIESEEAMLLILFTEQEQTEIYSPQANTGKKNSSAKDRRIKKLEQELAEAHFDALAFAQDQEAFTEELQSANEEVVSSNEELQTVNEELGTSKEETESANEELTVINQELQTRNDLLNQSYEYSEAIIATMHNPMLVLDKSLRVKSASETFYKKFKVNKEETEGVKLYELGNRQWNIPRLRELLEDILPKNSHFHDFEITNSFPLIGERIMLLNASRIVHKANQEELILLAFADVTEVRKLALEKVLKEKEALELQIDMQKKIAEAYKIANEKVQNLFLEAPAIICVHRGPEHVFELSSKIHQQVLGNRDIIGKPVRKAMPDLEGSGIYELLDHVYSTGEPFVGNEYLVNIDRGNGKLEEAYFNFVYQPTRNREGKIDGLLVHGVEVTEQIFARKKIEENEKQKAFLLKLSDALRPLSNPVDVEEAVTKIALDFLDADWCHYSTIEGDNLTIVHDAVRGDLPSVAGVYLISSFALFKAVMDAGRPFIVDDVHTTNIFDEDLKQLCIQLQNISFINVPVFKNGKSVGLLSVVQSKPRKWTDEEVQLTIEIAERTWAAVERAKAEQALRKSEEKYRTLFTSIDQGYALCELVRNKEGKGIDYYFLDVNPNYEKHSGMSKETVLGKTILQLFPTMDKLHIDTFAAVVDNQSPGVFERYFENNHRWYAINTYPGGKDRFAMLFSDITERKQAEEKITESEKKQAYLLKLSDAIKELMDPVEIQLTACRILGEHVKVNRVLYGEVINEEQIILNNNYVNGVSPIIATLDAEQFGRKVIDAFKRNEKVIISDITTDPGYTEEEKQSFLSLDVVANAGMGLVKGGRWVATFGMHYNAPRKWTATELWLLEETAERTWAAVVRARAEQALRKSEEKYRSLFTSIDQGFAFCELIRNKEGKGIDFSVLEVNATYERQAGVSAEMVLGKRIMQVFPTLDKWWIETYAAVVDDQRPVVFEQYSEPSQCWLEINAYPIEKDRFGILFSDITERKQAAEKISLRADEFEKAVKARTKELAEEREFSETILNTTVDLIGVYDKQMRIIGFNKASEDFFRINKEDIIGKLHTDVFPAAKGGQFEKDLLRALSGETIHNAIYHSTITGSYYENFLTPLKDTTGEVYAVVAIAHDVTESKSALEKIKQSEEKFNKLFDFSPISNTLSEAASGKIVMVNDAFTNVFGYSREEVLNTNSIELVMIDPVIRESLTNELKAKGKSVNKEIEFIKKSGEKFFALTSAEMITIGNDQYFLAAYNDISERKKAEKEIEQKNIELQNINKELDAFTYVSSHDLQAPLRKIRTLAELILEIENQNLSDAGKNHFRQMQNAAQRMQILIQDLLAFSKLSIAERKFETTNLNIIIEEAKSDFKDAITEKHAVITVKENCTVKVIPYQFRQLMHNLIGNALKFSKPDVAPHITIMSELLTSSPHFEGREVCHITISDNGIGFENKFAEKIFEVFQRLHGQQEYTGTGIGLAIVKKIVENHNGIITATSELNKGTTFHIYIPV